MADTPKLNDAFSRVSGWILACREYEKNPNAPLPFLVRTTSPVTDWPEGVEPQSNINDEFYTVRVNYNQLKELDKNPDIKSISFSRPLDPVF